MNKEWYTTVTLDFIDWGYVYPSYLIVKHANNKGPKDSLNLSSKQINKRIASTVLDWYV